MAAAVHCHRVPPHSSVGSSGAGFAHISASHARCDIGLTCVAFDVMYAIRECVFYATDACAFFPPDAGTLPSILLRSIAFLFSDRRPVAGAFTSSIFCGRGTCVCTMCVCVCVCSMPNLRVAATKNANDFFVTFSHNQQLRHRPCWIFSASGRQPLHIYVLLLIEQ